MSKIQNNISLFLIVILILLICKNTNFFKNLYDVTSKNHDSRQQGVYDFCEFFGTGYVFYIKNKYNLDTPPKIKNFERSPQQYWIFNKNFKKIDKDKLIILNKKKIQN